MPEQSEEEARLTTEDYEQVVDALVAAYPDKNQLYGVILYKWGVRLSDYIVTDQPGKLAVSELVEWTKSQGKTLRLLDLAWTTKNEEIRDLRMVAGRLIAKPMAKSGTSTRKLEKLAKESGLFDGLEKLAGTAIAEAAMATLGGVSNREMADNSKESAIVPEDLMREFEQAMCIVDIDGGSMMGTGFLIDHDRVLTAHSVVSKAINENYDGNRISLRFNPGKKEPEFTATAAGGQDWIGPWQSFKGDISATTSQSLDFAVIRLEKALPSERPVIALPNYVPIAIPQEDVAVLSFPKGGALSVDKGKLQNYSADGSRVHYSAATEPGSAGGPVVLADGKLVALHHAGSSGVSPKQGFGIPIWKIHQAITGSKTGLTG